MANKNDMQNLKLYGPLVGLMITILLICDCLAFKVVRISGYDFSASGLIFPFSFLLASIITDVYGFKLAGRIIWVQLICQAIFITLVNIMVILPSPIESSTAAHYSSLYGYFWPVIIAASIAVTSAYFINDIIMSKLKIYMSGRFFYIRFFLSNAIGKAILVSISYPINLYKLYTINEIAHIAINTWMYKISLSIILFPIALLITSIIKRIECLDYYDYGISYNPISVFSSTEAGKNKYCDNIREFYVKNYSNH